MAEDKTLVKYSSEKAPDWYSCAGCGAKDVKLWREYQTIDPKLLCVCCAETDQKKPGISAVINSDGRYQSEMGATDQIGWYVPAVPDEEGSGYWGYTSVPQAGVVWWRKLPSKK